MMNENNQVEFSSIEVAKKTKFLNGVGRFFAFCIGGFGILTGVLLCITVIGVIPGFFVVVGSLGFLALAMGKQKVSCPHCKKQTIVFQNVEEFHCVRCKNTTIITWK